MTRFTPLLAALGSGKTIQRSQCGQWIDLSEFDALHSIVNHVALEQLRIAPETIQIGEYTVPKPESVARRLRAFDVGTQYYIADTDSQFTFTYIGTWGGGGTV